MNSNLAQLIDNFAGLNVLVIGEAMLDSYLMGSTSRICREAPVPVVDVCERVDAPGGAANTAINLRSLGAHPILLSVMGDDVEGALLRQALERSGVQTDNIFVQPSRRTLAKHRVVAASHMLVRFDQGSTERIEESVEDMLIERLSDLYPCCDAVIVSDYGYGTLTPRIVESLARLQAQTPQLLVVDSKNLAIYRSIGVTAVKPNYEETIRLLGEPPVEGVSARADQIVAQSARILDLTGAQIAAVTLDSEGAFVFERGSLPYRTYAQPHPNSRAAGAGDTFVSALTLALAVGADTPAATELASAAAAVVVNKDGTAFCTAEELRGQVSAGGKHMADRARLAARLEAWRQQGKRIVFTNGCFDILHRGHITYLNNAKALGDVLVVGVNSDSSVARLKGPSRPINSLEDRVQVLGALSSVDYTIAFDEDTPESLLRAVRPDVFVKGGDYTRQTLPEAAVVEEYGGEVTILPYLDSRSTTKIIERIRQAYALPELDPELAQQGAPAAATLAKDRSAGKAPRIARPGGQGRNKNDGA